MIRSDVTPVMVSCLSRTLARSLTIPQLQAVGLDPKVFLDPCEPRDDRPELGNKWIADEALAWAVEFERPVLFLEDDVDLAPGFPATLDAALRVGEITYFYLNETPERMEGLYGPELAARLIAGQPTPVALTPARTVVGLFGTQAVLLPHATAVRLRHFIPKTRKAIDAALQLLITRDRAPVRVATPNVVQHRHDRTGREPESYAKRSISFDCPREAP